MKMKMMNKIWFYYLVIIGFFTVFNVSCTKDTDNPEPIPVIITLNVTEITQTTALSGGNITSVTDSIISVRGVCWSTEQNPTILDSKTADGTGTGNFSSIITGLTPNTKYYVRAYATNNAGTGYGDTISFTTGNVQVPVLSTTPIYDITTIIATSGGNITSDGGSLITTRGVCWSINATPTTSDSKTNGGNGSGSFVSNITGLTANTTYYVRAFASNTAGTGYGNIISFKTIAVGGAGTVTDIDGNVYNTVTIGTQVWMVENLKTTKYRNGDPIPNVSDNNNWPYLTSGARCDYNNEPSNSKVYGKLYNWYAVNSSKIIAPAGWHVPTDSEWTALTTYLLGENVAGGKLKEIGTTHWNSPNAEATNITGFTALPGGYRYANGPFGDIGNYGMWWTSSSYSSYNVYFYYMTNDNSGLFRDFTALGCGKSIRCIKD